MTITIGILKETKAEETRVSGTPDIVKKYVQAGYKVLVEKGAGENSLYSDTEYKEDGASLTARSDVLKKSNIVLCVQRPDEKDLKILKKDTILIGILDPYGKDALLNSIANQNVTSMSMEFVPRITRAQAMDVLSSQSNLAGYKAVLEATHYFNRAFPMMMTAAGTIAPARVFVMGAGVAGLQAIATAKRLGAIVSATDVRPAAKEQVASLGGNFIAVEDEEFKQAEADGGYAKEMSEEYKSKQAMLVEETLQKQDIIITTALIPGRPAPVLLSEKMVKSMKNGSVIVDLAAERGGNCALSEAGKIVTKHGVTIIAIKNMAARLGKDASALYSKNLFNLIGVLIKDNKITIDMGDEIIQGVTLTHNGKVVHPAFTKLTKPAKSPVAKTGTKVKKTPAKKAAKK